MTGSEGNQLLDWLLTVRNCSSRDLMRFYAVRKTAIFFFH